jgi:tetratricopeptide (TPR) repeat protein
MVKTDANDYSRFKDIEDDKSVEENKSEMNEIDGVKTLFEAILNAKSWKEKGNSYFGQDNYPDAKLSYEKGLDELSQYRNKDSANSKNVDELVNNLPAELSLEIKQLFIAIYGNLSLIATKEKNNVMIIHYCNSALQFDSNHVKCLCRRAAAYKAIQDLQKAKNDLLKCLSLDESNALAKKELGEVLQLIKEQNKKDKNSFANIFGNSKKGFYDDKEEEKEKKVKEREEKLAKDKEEWANSNAKRVQDGLEEETFEEWQKNLETFAKEKLEKGKEESKTQQTSPTVIEKFKKTSQKPPLTEKGVDYDEEDEKIMAETKAKGYCYFKNDIKSTISFFCFCFILLILHFLEAEAQLSSHEGPLKKADDEVKKPDPTITEVRDSGGKITSSSWNYAGTWEERDLTTTVKERLTEILSGNSVSSEPGGLVYSSKIDKVDKLEGEAQIVMTRGKKRHLFDFHAKVKFVVEVCHRKEPNELEEEKNETQVQRFKGTIIFNEITPSSSFEEEVQISYKKALPTELERQIKESINDLVKKIVLQIKSFENDYKMM